MSRIIQPYERELDMIVNDLLDINENLRELEEKKAELKAKAMQIMDDNFMTEYTDESGCYRMLLMDYKRNLVNKEKVSDLIEGLKLGRKEVKDISLAKDAMKESRIKFVTIKEIGA